MSALQRVFVACCGLLCAFLLVGAGFLACLVGPLTHALSSRFALTGLSPYGSEELARIADATRDFAFVGHDELALYQENYRLAQAHAQAHPDAVREAGFPALSEVKDGNDLAQLKAVFSRASERYCLSPDMVSHLDDCHGVAVSAYLLLGVSLAIVIAGLLVLRRKNARAAACIPAIGSLLTIAVFALLGIWALVSFNSLFTTFHQVFFSQGNWTFAADSVLICALPTEFWMGMGAVWLAVTLISSVVVAVISLRRIHALKNASADQSAGQGVKAQ